MKKEHLIYLMGIGLVVFLVSNFFSSKKNKEWLEENGLITTGTITPYGSDYICNYEVNGKEYQFKRSDLLSLQHNEKYKVAYEMGNPSNATVLFDEPILDGVFLESKTTSITKSINGYALFYFNIDGVKIKRFNEVKSNFEIDESKSYIVKYLKDNPKIAYIIC